MMRCNAREVVSTQNSVYVLFSDATFRVKDDINIRVKNTVADKVMIGFVPKGKGEQVQTRFEIFKDFQARCMV